MVTQSAVAKPSSGFVRKRSFEEVLADVRSRVDVMQPIAKNVCQPSEIIRYEQPAEAFSYDPQKIVADYAKEKMRRHDSDRNRRVFVVKEPQGPGTFEFKLARTINCVAEVHAMFNQTELALERCEREEEANKAQHQTDEVDKDALDVTCTMDEF